MQTAFHNTRDQDTAQKVTGANEIFNTLFNRILDVKK